MLFIYVVDNREACRILSYMMETSHMVSLAMQWYDLETLMEMDLKVYV